ncbi:MAG: protein kinase [Planctomycetes bacterium]|nr:protein kinase [Planctomycetota bacterium]
MSDRPDAVPPRPPAGGPAIDVTRRAPESALPQASAAPSRFGRYEIECEIARGGMGVVYRARQTDMGRTVALKVLLAGDHASAEDERRFVREAELAAQLAHPNIVTVYDVGVEGGRRYFTMELVDGAALDVWARGKGLEEKLRLAAKVCRAVHHANMSGIVHRDLKPANVLVTAAGEPKILDFGLAKAARPDPSGVATVSGAVFGTPFYMSPEQAAGKVREVDIRTDVYALGVIVYQLASGRLPFGGSDVFEVLQKIESEDAPSLAEAPLDVRLIVARAMEKEKSRRYASAEALAEDLERFLLREPISARPPSLAFLAKRWVRRHRTAAAVAAAVAACGAALAGWEWTRPGTLEVRADPPGAWLELDGRRIGPEARVAAGWHGLRAGADGFETEERAVRVARGERQVVPLALRRSTGRLFLEADERAATVTIDGKPAGGTPLQAHVLPAGDHELRVQGRGLRTVTRRIRVERGRDGAEWVSLPPCGYAFTRVPDAGATPFALRDADGDGILDVATALLYSQQVFSGRTAAELQRTPLHEGTFRVSLATADCDGDGVPDDVVLAYGEGTASLQALSGKGPRAGEAAPAQARLWRREFALASEELRRPPLVVVGAEAWAPIEDRVVRVRLADGTESPAAALRGAVALHAVEGGTLAIGGEEALLLRADASAAWRAPLAGPTFVVSAGALVLRDDRGLFALDRATGSIRWRTPFPSGAGALSVFLEAGGTVVAAGEGRIAGFDASSGAPGYSIVESTAAGRPLVAAASDVFFYARDRELVARSSTTGALLWTFPLATRIVAPPAVQESPGGLEVFVATADGLVTKLDAEGRETAQTQVEQPPLLLHPCALDRDGRTDLVLLGYGVQVLRDTRVLWKRRMANAVRPLPLVVRVEGRPLVILAGRWEDGESRLRALDGATGRVAWSLDEDFDVIREPALADWDRDGVPDVWIHVKARFARLAVVSGRTGAILATAPSTGSAVPYAPAALRDLDRDGTLDAVLFPWAQGAWAVRPGDDRPLWKADTGTPLSAPLVEDLDGDGAPEIVAAWDLPEGGGAVAALSPAGRVLWSLDTDWVPRTRPVAFDTDADGRPEILVSAAEGLLVLDSKGALRSRHPGLGGSLAGPAPLDADGDGRPELLTGTSAGATLLRADLSPIWLWKGARVSGALGVADLPGAGRCVVGADRAGVLFCARLADGSELWRMHVGQSESGVTVEDLTGDGIAEALVGSADYALYAIELW